METIIVHNRPIAVAFVLAVSAAIASSSPVGRASAAGSTSVVLNYTFDNDSRGVVFDSSASGLHGTLMNADPVRAYVSSITGRKKALRLIGTERQYVAVPESNHLDVNRHTLAALVRYTGVENDQTNERWEVLEKAGAYWLNIRTDGRVRVGGFFGDCVDPKVWRYLDSTRTIAKNTWTHVAGTYDGSRLRVWINGRSAGGMPVSGATCVNNEPLAIGAKVSSTGSIEAFYDGRLDDIRIYRRALSGAEIRGLVPV